MLCAGQRPHGSLQNHSGSRQATTPCQSKALLTLHGESRSLHCSQVGIEPQGRREERCRPSRGLERRHRPHPSTQAGRESVLHWTSREAIWGCPGELDPLGPMQADTWTQASVASKPEEAAAKHPQHSAHVVSLLLAVAEIKKRDHPFWTSAPVPE